MSLQSILLLAGLPTGPQLVFDHPPFSHSRALIDALNPKTLLDKHFSLTLNNLNFIGVPSTMRPPPISFEHRVLSRSFDISLVHLVLVFDGQIDSKFITAEIAKISTILQYEQIKRDFVMKQVETIFNLRDKFSSHQDIISNSSLAENIASIYDAVKSNKLCRFLINSSVDVSILPTIDHVNETSLRPYKALLLLDDAESIINNLPKDPSPLLVQLIQIVTPFICFEDIQSVLDCSLSQIYRLAAHLVYWRQAKIINVLSQRNIYIVSKDADLKSLPELSISFNEKFPGYNLYQILSLLKTQNPYSTIPNFKENKQTYLEILLFLFKNNLAIQLNFYIYLMIPSSITSEKVGHVVADTRNLTDLEQDYINQIGNTQPDPYISIFNSILPFLGGKFSINEISFFTGVSRKDFKTVLGRYREYFITCLK